MGGANGKAKGSESLWEWVCGRGSVHKDSRHDTSQGHHGQGSQFTSLCIFLFHQVVYIDTEGTFRPDRIRQIAEAKGVSPEAAMENIVYAR